MQHRARSSTASRCAPLRAFVLLLAAATLPAAVPLDVDHVEPIASVCAVAPDILAIRFIAQSVEHPMIAAYAPAAGDEVVERKDAVWSWDERAAAFAETHERDVFRTVDG